MSDRQYIIIHKENVAYKKLCHHVMCAEKYVIGCFHHEGEVLVTSPLVRRFHVNKPLCVDVCTLRKSVIMYMPRRNNVECVNV